MLDELGSIAPAAKRRSLKSEIEGRATKNALGGEAELAIVWALSKVCNLAELESVKFDGYPPDAISDDLCPGFRSVVEVTAVSDDLDAGGTRRLTTKDGFQNVTRSSLGAAIIRKDRKFERVADGSARILVLFDAGCRLANNPNGVPIQWNAATGRDVILFHASKTRFVDVLCLVYWVWDERLGRGAWNTFLCDVTQRVPHEALAKLGTTLPQLNGSTVRLRQMHREGAFRPRAVRLRRSTTYIFAKEGGHSMKVSARLLQDVLAGRVTAQDYETSALADFQKGVREHLDEGRLIKKMYLEPLGPDVDDDLIVFEFADDPAASPLRV
jgi:hypothetical protein